MYQKYPPLKWSCIYVPHNLGICTILRLHYAFLETACNSWDCAIAIRKHNRLMGWEWLSWLMEGSWELSEMVMDALNGGNPQVLGSLGARTQTKGKGVSLSRWTSQKSLVWGAWVHAWHGDNGAARAAPYLYTRWKLEWWPGFSTELACKVPRNLKIV